MRVLLIFLLAFHIVFCDPFYYGDSLNIKKDQDLKLLGIFNKKANINGKWIKINESFIHNEKSLKLINIENSCAILQEKNKKKPLKVCFAKTKIIKINS